MTFGPTFSKFNNDEIQRLNIFQNTAMMETLRIDRQTSPAVLRVVLGVCDIEHWVDYLNLINYFRIKTDMVWSAVNKVFEVSAEYLDNYYNFNRVADIKNILIETNNELIDLVPSEYLLLSKYNPNISYITCNKLIDMFQWMLLGW